LIIGKEGGLERTRCGERREHAAPEEWGEVQ